MFLLRHIERKVSPSTLTHSRKLSHYFEHGHWVVHKTKNRFSAMPIDQAHEQNNAIVKESGGAVGLTQLSESRYFLGLSKQSLFKNLKSNL